MTDPKLPLTLQEYSEWGNSNVPEQLQLMESYSPYENIPFGREVPSVLLTSEWHPYCCTCVWTVRMFDARLCYPVQPHAKLQALHVRSPFASF